MIIANPIVSKWLTLLAALLTACAMPALARDTDDARAARDILSLSGAKAGLCAHIGCGRKGSAALTAELAANSKMLVHGICWDTEALTRTREAVAARKVIGQASAENLDDGPLPYVRHLCNLVVVEDMKTAAAHGASPDELMRVLAPGGVLCILEDGQWTKTIQSRPEGMDDWTHPHHGPDGNVVSEDKLVHFPLGQRWIGGTARSINKWTGVRGWVLAGGRCYIVSSSEIENLGLEEKPHYLVCRDAFNGLPLWKIPLETAESGGRLYWRNTACLAADDQRVYLAAKGKVIIVDGATGKIEHTIKTKYQTERLILLDKTLILSCWKERQETLSVFERRGLWAPDVNTANGGSVAAYACDTGKQLWRRDHAAYSLLGANGAAYLLTRNANPATTNHVIAVDARSGEELWSIAHTALGEEADLQFDLAGPGFLAVSKRSKESLHILDTKTGTLLWSKQYGTVRPAGWKGQTPYRFMSLVDGQLWYAAEKLDPLTGKVVGKLPKDVPRKGLTTCVQPIVFGNMWAHTRRVQYIELRDGADSSIAVRTNVFHAARGGCIQGMTPANGMLYTSQNNCQCEPGQVLGFLAFGPNGDHPTADVFAKPRPVERGPAFAQARPAACDTNAWPMQRANTSRSNMTGGAAPAALDILWQVSAATPDTGPMAPAWNARLAPVLTPPVAAGGRVFVAATETGQVKAFDLKTGASAWTVTLGSRIDSAPTILGNLCVVGSHDGWVYALTTDKGTLAWRTRVAPKEQRIVANGRVESTWPAIGSVLAHDGTLMAHAGRSSEADGGIAVVQLDPATGRTIWAGRIGPGPQRHADLLRVAASNVVCNGVTIALGAGISTESQPKASGRGTTMLRGYLGQTEMRGFKSPPGARATAGEHEIIADVLPDGGSIKVIKAGSTNVIAQVKLDSSPIHDGLAMADRKAIVALTDGRLMCLGRKLRPPASTGGQASMPTPPAQYLPTGQSCNSLSRLRMSRYRPFRPHG